jgi:Ca2+-binding EF-hand superfamily protein
MNDVASRETYAQFLARWDREGDRTLSRAEFKGIFGRRYELRNPALVTQLTKRAMERDIGDLFAKIDKNHDGRVSKPELILALRRDEALALRLGLCKGAIRDDSELRWRISSRNSTPTATNSSAWRSSPTCS